KIYFTVDGQEVVSGTKPIEQPVASINFFKQASSADGSIWVDDMISVDTVPSPYAPEVDSLTVEGTCMVGEELTANESISDANGDPLDTPLYQWESSSDQTVWTEIEGATQKTYTPVEGDLGKYLRVGVTPRSTVEPKLGTKAYAQAGSKISVKKDPPSATDVSITGTAAVGNILTAEYSYVPSQGRDDEGESLFVWETAADQAGSFTQVQSSTSKTYTVTAAEAGKYIRVKVIPKDINGLAGEEVSSQPVQIDRGVAYYVATNGSDDNPGSIDAPFATIEKARDVIAASSLPEGGITVYIRGGTYEISKAISFEKAHSGQQDKPIVYAAYEGEKVVFMGGKTLDASKIKPVTDQSVLNRILDPLAKERVMQLDLGAQGITNIPAISDYGFSYSTQYRPEEVYFNGSALSKARWPNEEAGGGFTKILSAEYDEIDYRTKPFSLEYEDEDNHTALWDPSQIKDLQLGGFVGYDWAQSSNQIASIDTKAKTLTTVGGTTYPPRKNQRIYFFNLLEEIDVPGESYIDRDKNILYFYPTGDVVGAEMSIATFDGNMISVKGASDITFRGIQFDTSRNTMAVVNNSDRVKIEDCVFARGSANAVTLTGNDCAVTGCHVYEMGSGGISISGGSRKTLTGGGNLVENNRIHSVNRVYNSSQPGIAVRGGYGHILRHNLVYDGPHTLMQLFGTNDVTIEYNELKNGVREAGDIGAIYWGRHPTEMGIVIRYNYFHDMGSDYNLGIGQQSVFWDDGASGPDMYGNVFYRGSRTTEMGGIPNRNYVVKTNGGQFSNIHNNLFIDAPTAVYFQNWNYAVPAFGNKALPGRKQGRWFAYVQDMIEGTNYMWNRLVVDTDFESDTFKSHYQDTLWAPFWNHMNSEIHEQAVRLHQAGDTEGLYNLAVQYAPENSNVFENNVTVKVDTDLLPHMNTSSSDEDNYNLDEAVLPSGEAMFANYGTDFTLTKAGLAEIQKNLPDFEDIPFDKMGLLTQVGGSEPSASNLRLSGVAVPGGRLSASFDYSDPDGDHQGASKITWYIGDSADGEFQLLSGKQGSEILLDDSYAGRYIRCQVVPYDDTMLYGEAVTSQALKVIQTSDVDKSALIAVLNQASALIAGASFGEEPGQYPESAKAELEQAIEAAQEVVNNEQATQYAVNQTTDLLKTAVLKFESQQITAADQFQADITRMSVNSLLKDTENWKTVAGDVSFEDGSLVIQGDSSSMSWVSYAGKQFKNVEFSFKYKAERLENDPLAWGGIYLRQSNPEGILWTGGNVGSMIDLKQDKIMFQEYPSIAIYDTLENQHLEMGHEYIITAGLYDLSNEEKVALVLTMDGKTVYAKVLDSNALYGKEGYLGFNAGKNTKVTISPLYADKTVLNQVIEQTEDFLRTARQGDQYGQYPSAAVSALNTSLNEAKVLQGNEDVVQTEVNKAAAALNEALVHTKMLAKSQGTVSENGTVIINYDLPQAELTVEPGVSSVSLQVDPAQPQPEITVEGADSAMKLNGGTLVSGNIAVPLAGGVPSGSFTLGTANQVYGAGAEAVTADLPVRIVLKGQAGRQVAYRNEKGTYSIVLKSIKSDDFQTAQQALSGQKYPAVKMESGKDIVLYTTLLTEFITYSPQGNSPLPAPTDAPVIPPSSSGSSSGFVSSNPPVQVLTGRFQDIAGHWAENDINEMANQGIVSGVTDTTFEPDREITRAEFAALIARALKISYENEESVFRDVAAPSWYAKEVNAAAAAGLISGYDGFFRPEDSITREEMAVIIVKAYQLRGG
ncbi:MAG: S-layer homology domain-containing protein, partial [Clostridia bacterium]|nr:S-layer homology domain-containing protein [Clostridia bacterium]